VINDISICWFVYKKIVPSEHTTVQSNHRSIGKAMSGPTDNCIMESKEPNINYSTTNPLPSRIPVMLGLRKTLHSEKLPGSRNDPLSLRYTAHRDFLPNEDTTLSDSTGSNQVIGSSPSSGSFDLAERSNEDLESNTSDLNSKGVWKVYQTAKETDHPIQPSPLTRTPAVSRYVQSKDREQPTNERKQIPSLNSSRPLSPKILPATPPIIPERQRSPRNVRGKGATLKAEDRTMRSVRGQKNKVNLSSMETKYKDQYKLHLKFQNDMNMIKEKLKVSTKSLNETRESIVNAGYTITLPIPEEICEVKEEKPKESKGTTTEGIDDVIATSLSESIENLESQKKLIAEKMQIVFSFLEQYQPIMEKLEQGKGDNLDVEISKLVDDVRVVESHQIDLEESVKNVAREFFDITEARKELLNISETSGTMKLMQSMREKLQDLENQNQLVLEEKNYLQNEHQKEMDKLYKRYEEELQRSSELEKKLILSGEMCKKLESQTQHLQSTLHEVQKQQRNIDIVQPIQESLEIANNAVSNLKSENEELAQQIIKLRENGKLSEESVKYLKAQIEKKEEQMLLLRKQIQTFESQRFNILSMLKTFFELKDEDVNDPELMSFIKEADYENLKTKIKSLKLTKEPENSEDHIIDLLKPEQTNTPFNDLRDVVIYNLNRQLSQQKKCLLRLIKNMEEKNETSALRSSRVWKCWIPY